MAVTRVVWRTAVEKIEALMTEQQEYGLDHFIRVSGVHCHQVRSGCIDIGCTAETLDGNFLT